MEQRGSATAEDSSMATAVLEIEGTWEELVARAQEFAGHRLRLTVLTQRSNNGVDSGEERNWTARELLQLPLEERRRILAEQAEAAAPLYEADLALPPELRELTAFTAIND